MRTLVPAAFLAMILAFLLPPVPAVIKTIFRRRPALLFAAPAFLAATFCFIARRLDAWNWPVTLLIIVYTFVPTICVFLQGMEAGAASWLDFIVILLLWLPIELNAGARWIPRQAQGLLHTVAYGVGITLALVLFLSFRGMKGMKYTLPTRVMDFIDPLVAFVLLAPILIVLGLALGFLPPIHVPGNLSALRIAKSLGLIFVATALPEEILFRSLIQNWLMQKFGSTTGVLVVASVIFGAAHLNNGPQPLPNWRYMILATIAGYAYGRVFQRASSAAASMALHALVDVTKHVFF